MSHQTKQKSQKLNKFTVKKTKPNVKIDVDHPPMPKDCLNINIGSKVEDNTLSFESELYWCIEQLQQAVDSKKLNAMQIKEHKRLLTTLMNESTPIIKKRQLMRIAFGDYREKMAKEEAQIFKKNQILKIVPNNSNIKSVFVKKSSIINDKANIASTSTSTAPTSQIFREKTDSEVSLDIKLESLSLQEPDVHPATFENYLKRYSLRSSKIDNNFRFNFNPNN